MNKLKYVGYSIVFQEVPNEVTLAINVSGCPHHCEGCHSQYLWEYKGNYIDDDIDNLLQNYKNLITCVCFMGGDQNQEDLEKLLSKVRKNNIKTALYSGYDSLSNLTEKIVSLCDYIKIGHYDSKCGGLDKTTTNQRMYSFENGCKDITNFFWRKNVKT